METTFPAGIPVKGEDLIDREECLNQLQQMLTSGQSVVLSSPRRYGKTSICLELLRRLKNKYFTVYLDVFLILNKRGLAEEIVDKTLENKQHINFIHQVKERFMEVLHKVEFRQVIKDFEFVLSFKDENNDEWKLLKQALDFPEKFAKKYKKKMIVIIDEFGDLDKLNGVELFKFMRATFQRHSCCSYLFTGSHESIMKKIFLNKKQPFFRFGTMMDLDVLPKKETSCYVKEKFKKGGISIFQPEIDYILEKSGCHPYYLQLLCQKTYLGTLAKRKKRLKKKDIDAAYLEAILGEKDFFEELWIGLMSRKHYAGVVKEILLGERSIYAVSDFQKMNLARIIKDLKDKGIIKRERKEYVLRDPFFRDYLKMRLEGKLLG